MTCLYCERVSWDSNFGDVVERRLVCGHALGCVNGCRRKSASSGSLHHLAAYGNVCGIWREYILVHLCECHRCLCMCMGVALAYPFVVQSMVWYKSVHDDIFVYC